MSSQTKNFLAIFLGSANISVMDTWKSLPEEQRRAKEQAGIAAWHAWAEKHKDKIVELGSPLGKTKRVTKQGVEDTRNNITGYTLVRAASHDEAAGLFENHPHFSIFPGESIEIMECLPIPAPPK